MMTTAHCRQDKGIRRPARVVAPTGERKSPANLSETRQPDSGQTPNKPCIRLSSCLQCVLTTARRAVHEVRAYYLVVLAIMNPDNGRGPTKPFAAVHFLWRGPVRGMAVLRSPRKCGWCISFPLRRETAGSRLLLTTARRAVCPRPDSLRVLHAAVPFTLLPAAWKYTLSPGRRQEVCDKLATYSTSARVLHDLPSAGHSTAPEASQRCLPYQRTRRSQAEPMLNPAGEHFAGEQDVSATSGVGSMPTACPA